MRTLHPTLVSLAVVAALGCGGGAPEAAPGTHGAGERLQVELGTVTSESISRMVEVVGSVLAREQVTVVNEVPGTVARLHADFGDVVEQDAVLLELDRRELELRTGAARAATAQAEAHRERARANWERAVRLQAEEAISRERLDAVRAEHRVAEADSEAAAKELALAEKRLGDATVRAPFRAAVQARHVALGQHVPAFTPLFELVATGAVKFRGEVPERFAPLVRSGQRLEVEAEGLPGAGVPGAVTRVAAALTPATRTLPFESDIADAPAALAPGLFARGRLYLDPAPGVLMPRAALVQFAGVDRVFVLREGRVESRPVTVGGLFGDRVEVLAGLTAGERVVVTGQERLEDGMAVDGQSETGP